MFPSVDRGPDAGAPGAAAPPDAPAGGAPTAAAPGHAARVLVADDEETIRLAVGRFLGKRGYEAEVVATGAAAVAAVEAAPGRYAVLLCDVRMPGVGGLDVAARARAADPDLAVVMLSGVHDAATARAAFAAGAADYLLKPLELAALDEALAAALRRRALDVARRGAERALRDEVAQYEAALGGAAREARGAAVAVADALVAALEARDPYQRGRAARVAALAASVAAECGLDEDMVEAVRLAGRLHDVGTIGVRDTVLHKPGALTPEETAHVRTHVALGLEILSPLGGVRGMQPVLRAVADHHERWDGTGYPRGLAGPAIDIGGRVLAAADAWDAVTSARAYRGAMEPRAALAYLAGVAGSMLDPGVYRALSAVVERGGALTFLE
jgi:response regulator RpfG family c-di-GMP phosphodiesterase